MSSEKHTERTAGLGSAEERRGGVGSPPGEPRRDVGRPTALANLERTRQQIQELDQLLQQMLALPLAEEKPSEAKAGPPQVVEPEPPAEQPRTPKRLQTLEADAAFVPAAVIPEGVKRPLPLPEAEPEQAPDAAVRLEASVAVQAAKRSGSLGTAPKRSLPYRAAVRLNLGLERVLHRLGPLGQLLLKDSVREWLGWLGLVLLVAAAALSVGVLLGWNW